MTFYAYTPPPLVLTLSSITHFLLFSSFAHLILLYLLHYTDTCPLLSSPLYLLFGGYLPDGVTMHGDN
jgi:hypothetical protein